MYDLQTLSRKNQTQAERGSAIQKVLDRQKGLIEFHAVLANGYIVPAFAKDAAEVRRTLIDAGARAENILEIKEV